MPKYCQEKFTETTNGAEVKVCWRQDKHVHDATLITAIELWLQAERGGQWRVRANSYQSNQSSCSVDAISYG
ncbi:hypothetical protein [Cupriavidus sp. CP313]